VKRDTTIGLLLLMPVGVACLWSLGAFVDDSGSAPAAADYAAVVDAIDARAVDAVYVVPPWSLTGLTVPGLRERLAPGDGPWATLAARHAQIAVVHEPDSAPWERPLPPSTSTKTLGRLRVTTHRFAGTAYDFRAHVEDAAVDVDGVACVERVRASTAGGARRGVRCAGKAQRVTREWALVTENGADVIWAAPPPAGSALTLRYAGVAVGKALVVAAGHTRDGADGGVAVRVRVRIDDTDVATLVRAPTFFVEPHRRALHGAFVGDLGHGGEGFSVDVIDTAAYEGVHDVAFVVDAVSVVDGEVGFAIDAFIPRAE
jgi:hypothetical protein